MNYKPFKQVKVQSELLPDEVLVNSDGVTITQPRNFEHLKGVKSDSFSITSMLSDGIPMHQAAKLERSKLSMADEAIAFQANFKPTVNNE